MKLKGRFSKNKNNEQSICHNFCFIRSSVSNLSKCWHGCQIFGHFTFLENLPFNDAEINSNSFLCAKYAISWFSLYPKNALLYSLLNKSLWRNFYSFFNFFVKLTEKTVLQYFCSLGAAKVLKPLGSKSIAGLFFQFHVKFSSAIPLLPI